MKKVLFNTVFLMVFGLVVACSSKETVSDDVAMSGGTSSGSGDVAMADLGSSSSGRAR